MLKNSGDPLVEELKRDRIRFFIERKIDQSLSMVTTPEDKANDVIGQADFADIFATLCSQQLYFSRQIRASGKISKNIIKQGQ